eukprot:s4023_g3.t1
MWHGTHEQKMSLFYSFAGSPAMHVVWGGVICNIKAELDLAEERLRLGEACLEDALRLVVPVDDGQSQLAEVVEELERQQASLEVAEAARDSLQDEASDMLLLFHAAESRAAEWIPQTRVPRSHAGILEAEMFGVEVMKDWSGRGHKMEGA